MMYLIYHALGDVAAFICSMVQGSIFFNHFFHMYELYIFIKKFFPS